MEIKFNEAPTLTRIIARSLVDRLSGCYITSNYDHATSLLDKLQQLAGFQGTQTTFDTRLKTLAGVNITPRYLHFTARQYIEKLVRAGILREVTGYARNQIYRADEVFSALDNLQD